MKTGNKRCDKLYDQMTIEGIKTAFKYVYPPIKDKKERKLYFAGPFFTDKAKIFQLQVIELWDNIEKQNRFTYGYFPMLEQENTPCSIFRKNTDMLNACDEMLAFVSEKDVGTALEIGYFIAREKPVTLLVLDDTDFLSHTNLMLSFGAPAININKLYKFFTKGCDNDDYIKVENVWEGIE